MKATPLEPEIITRKGKPVSIILPIKKYAELLERVEDAEDIAWLRKARQKPLSYRPNVQLRKLSRVDAQRPTSN